METTGNAVGRLSADAQSRDLPLDRISTCADRVERLGSIVKQFSERFYNGPEDKTAASGTPSGVPVGHIGQIARLNDAIDFLDSAVQTLSTIG